MFCEEIAWDQDDMIIPMFAAGPGDEEEELDEPWDEPSDEDEDYYYDEDEAYIREQGDNDDELESDEFLDEGFE